MNSLQCVHCGKDPKNEEPTFIPLTEERLAELPKAVLLDIACMRLEELKAHDLVICKEE